MMIKSIATALMVSVAATSVQALDLHFCWTGGGGYTMVGQMKLPEGAMSRGIITEQDVTAFRIDGFHQGQRIGGWDMSQRAADTTWHLRFDPVGLEFLTGDHFSGTRSQGWNANGAVNNCGEGGFGFNSGSAAQDICLGGRYVSASSIAPDTPLMARIGPFPGSCEVALGLS